MLDTMKPASPTVDPPVNSTRIDVLTLDIVSLSYLATRKVNQSVSPSSNDREGPASAAVNKGSLFTPPQDKFLLEQTLTLYTSNNRVQ